MEFFNFHTHQFTNQSNILELVNQYPQEFDASIPNYSIGIHPWYIDENRIDEDLRIIEEKLQTPNCLAIGECGLDKRIEVGCPILSDNLKRDLLERANLSELDEFDKFLKMEAYVLSRKAVASSLYPENSILE